MELDGVKRPRIAMKRRRSKVLPANESIFLKSLTWGHHSAGDTKDVARTLRGEGVCIVFISSRVFCTICFKAWVLNFLSDLLSRRCGIPTVRSPPEAYFATDGCENYPRRPSSV